jgi:hypothetical protein
MHHPLNNAFAVAACIGAAACTGTDHTRDIGAPMGLLGHRIGTYLRIEGVREETGKAGQQTLCVDRVGGEALSQPIDIWIENVALPAGTRCVLNGYESGRWIGVPHEIVMAGHAHPQQAMWQFQRYFVMTSAETPATLVKK